MPTLPSLNAKQELIHMGSEDLNLDNIGPGARLSTEGSGNTQIFGTIGTSAILEASGSGDLVINQMENQVFVDLRGSGDVKIHRNVGSGLTLKARGSGDLYINHIGDSASFDIKGSGNLTVRGNTGAEFALNALGSGDIFINELGDQARITLKGRGDATFGKVGKGAIFNAQGSATFHFSEGVADDAQFEGELINAVYFTQKPSDLILAQVKAAQERALISNIGFMSVNGYKIKSGAGWIRVIKDSTETLYRGNHFQIINDKIYLDGKEQNAVPKKSSIFSKIDAFSIEHPVLFLLLTAGLGLLWYLAKALTYAVRFEQITISINIPQSKDTYAYFLADFDALASSTKKDSPQAFKNLGGAQRLFSKPNEPLAPSKQYEPLIKKNEKPADEEDSTHSNKFEL